MANHEIAENISSRSIDRFSNAASIAASSWSDMHLVLSDNSKPSMPAMFGNLELIAQTAIEATMPVPMPFFKVDFTAPEYLKGLEKAHNPEKYTHFYKQQKEAEHLNNTQEKTASSYGEPPAEAATKKADRWNPSKGELNPLDPSSWTKLQAYAGDIGRANHWSREDKGTFPQVNALRHALSSAYIAYHDGASVAIAGGLWHELQTGIDETRRGIPSSKKPEDVQTWNDHNVDINNNLAGAKIAQEILDTGGSWHDVEKAIVDTIKHHLGKDGRIAQPTHRLHTFLGS